MPLADPFGAPVALLMLGLLLGLALERARAGRAAARVAAIGGRDPLTGLLNRRGFEAAVARLPPGARGSALLALDLDRFRLVNDAHGRPVGDAVLAALEPRLRGVLRGGDLLARVGGDEVLVFLPSIAPAEARAVAERLRLAVSGVPFDGPRGQALRLTASLGGAWAPPAAEGGVAGPVPLDALAARADAALGQAKREGRDRARFAPEAVLAPTPAPLFPPAPSPAGAAAQAGAPQ